MTNQIESALWIAQFMWPNIGESDKSDKSDELDSPTRPLLLPNNVSCKVLLGMTC